MPDAAEVRVNSSADYTVVELAGELDLAQHDPLRNALAEALERELPVLVDLSDCSFVDVGGVRLLGQASQAARELVRPFLVILPFNSAGSVRRLVLDLLPELAPFALVPNRAAATVNLADSLANAARTDDSRLHAIRAAIWEAGARLNDLLAHRDELMLEQRAALAARRRPTRAEPG
jgi:anti-anti-sigma factor